MGDAKGDPLDAVLAAVEAAGVPAPASLVWAKGADHQENERTRAKRRYAVQLIQHASDAATIAHAQRYPKKDIQEDTLVALTKRAEQLNADIALLRSDSGLEALRQAYHLLAELRIATELEAKAIRAELGLLPTFDALLAGLAHLEKVAPRSLAALSDLGSSDPVSDYRPEPLRGGGLVSLGPLAEAFAAIFHQPALIKASGSRTDPHRNEPQQGPFLAFVLACEEHFGAGRNTPQTIKKHYDEWKKGLSPHSDGSSGK